MNKYLSRYYRVAKERTMFPMWMKLAIICVGLMAYPQTAFGHGALGSPYISFDPQFSAADVRVGDTIQIHNILSNRSNETLVISAPTILDNEQIRPLSSTWQIVSVNPQQSIVLEPMERTSFEIQLQALKPGIFHLHPVFQVGNNSVVGKGQMTFVTPDEISTYQVTVGNDTFNGSIFTDAPIDLENVSLSEEDKTLTFNLRTNGNVSNDSGLMTIWVPTALIHNDPLGTGDLSKEPLEISIDGVSPRYWKPIFNETHEAYIIQLPPDASKIEMTGSYVIPEFGAILTLVMMIGTLTAVVYSRILNKK